MCICHNETLFITCCPTQRFTSHNNFLKLTFNLYDFISLTALCLKDMPVDCVKNLFKTILFSSEKARNNCNGKRILGSDRFYRSAHVLG